MDGAGCAVLFLVMGGQKDNIRFVGPESIDKTITELANTYSGHLLFADVSMNEADAVVLNTRENVTVLDHHKTAIHLKKYPWAILSADENDIGAGKACGTLMMWEHFLLQHNEIAEYEGMARMIDDYDRWIHKNPMSQKFADLHSLTNTDYFISKFLTDSRVRLEPMNEKILEIDKINKEEYLKRKLSETVVIEKNGIKLGLVLGNRYISECCHYLLNNHEAVLDVLCMVDVEGNKVSLRGKREQVNVAEIAALNGGGGHNSSAGFYLKGHMNLDVRKTFLKKLKLPTRRKLRSKPMPQI
jgi:oligoribonuclease NrnB/cAMP/cGMP phosphodiesterase (DHH superfamily)